MEAFPIPYPEDVTIANKFVNEFITRFGMPTMVHTDQGRQLESTLFQEMCKLLKIEKTRTTAFHAQSNGLVERMNHTLESMLRAFVSDHQKDWGSYLSSLLMACRATPQIFH